MAYCLKLYEIPQMESYFHKDHATRICFAALPDLVTKSQKHSKSRDEKKDSHLRRASLRV